MHPLLQALWKQKCREKSQTSLSQSKGFVIWSGHWKQWGWGGRYSSKHCRKSADFINIIPLHRLLPRNHQKLPQSQRGSRNHQLPPRGCWSQHLTRNHHRSVLSWMTAVTVGQDSSPSEPGTWTWNGWKHLWTKHKSGTNTSVLWGPTTTPTQLDLFNFAAKVLALFWMEWDPLCAMVITCVTQCLLFISWSV